MNYWEKQLSKAEKELEKAAELVCDMTYGCLALALHKYYGYGQKRIFKVMDKAAETSAEVGKDLDLSMLQLLEQETGIEIRMDDGSRWEDKIFLNASKWDGTIRSYAQMISVRRAQIKWLEPTVLAECLMGMHKREKFGQDRLADLYKHIISIKTEYNRDIIRISEQLKEQLNIKIIGNGETGCLVDLKHPDPSKY